MKHPLSVARHNAAMIAHRTCDHCGEAFTPRRAGAPTRYCGTRCMGLAKRTLPEPQSRPCVVCATVFTPRRKYQQQRYCSPSCQWIESKGPEYNAKISRESAERRSDEQRGFGEQKTYRKFMGRHEHRAMAEMTLGRPLKDGEIVRFRSDDRQNTDPENLEVLPDRAAFARTVFSGRKHSADHLAKRIASRKATLNSQ